jgi:hypothetical protein
MSAHTPTAAGGRPCAGGDVRGFYARLGIALPDRRGPELAVRCFADPGAHRHADRRPSMSVSLVCGAWCCHGCGAAGGAYDAAVLAGHSPRAAIDLLVDHGLAEPRTSRPPRRTSTPTPSVGGQPRRVDHGQPAVTAGELAGFAAALARDRGLLAALRRERCWTSSAIASWALGVDGGRVVIPVRDAAGRLAAVLRYDPRRECRGPKVIAVSGSSRTLYPAPETVVGGRLVIVEGEPDAIAAHSAGLPAVAVPGSHGWRTAWTGRFHGREVIVIADSDRDGRRLACTITADLQQAGIRARAVDLHPGRDDGGDLTDWLRVHRHRRLSFAELNAATDLWVPSR